MLSQEEKSHFCKEYLLQISSPKRCRFPAGIQQLFPAPCPCVLQGFRRGKRQQRGWGGHSENIIVGLQDAILA